MQMQHREYVEGTEPAIYIGHRIYRKHGGSASFSKVYHAEYTLDSRQRSKSLRTSSKSVAIHAAHTLCELLRQEVEEKPLKKISVEELKETYLVTQTNRGRADKTMAKYRHNLDEFALWWEKHDGRAA